MRDLDYRLVLIHIYKLDRERSTLEISDDNFDLVTEYQNQILKSTQILYESWLSGSGLPIERWVLIGRDLWAWVWAWDGHKPRLPRFRECDSLPSEPPANDYDFQGWVRHR